MQSPVFSCECHMDFVTIRFGCDSGSGASLMRTSFAAVLLLSSALRCCYAQTPATAPASPAPTEEQIKAAGSMPFVNASLPIEQRVDDLVSRLTLEEKVSQLIDRRCTDSSSRYPRLQLVERGTARHRAFRIRHSFPTGHRKCSDLGCTAVAEDQHGGFDGSAGQIQRRDSALAITIVFMDSQSGRPTSTSFVIHAGGAARKPTERILSSPADLGSHL